MFARLSAFVVWSLVAMTAVFWVLRLVVQAPAAPLQTVAVGKSAGARGDLTRLLGATPVAQVAAAATPEASSRFRLVGVMAPKQTAQQSAPHYGLALIAVDGKPPRAFSVGSKLDTDLVLQSVGLRSASIGPQQGPRSVMLELPALPEPATGKPGMTPQAATAQAGRPVIAVPGAPPIPTMQLPAQGAVPPALPATEAGPSPQIQ
jgi:general secretion pathway protein C